MPLDVKEFIIQARFEDDKNNPESQAAEQKKNTDYITLKEELISECIERIEELLRKRDRR